VHGIHAATYKVENSAQGSSCKLKFVHAHIKQVKKRVHVCKDNAHVAEGAILILNNLQISICGKKFSLALTQLQMNKISRRKRFSFTSDISDVSYNIRLTMIGQLATFL
jgi:hypothetical protein